MCGGMVSKAMNDKRESEWRAEEDHRTLQRAAEVRSDPKRIKSAAEHHRKKMAEMSTVGRTLGVSAPPLREKRPTKVRAAKRSMATGR